VLDSDSVEDDVGVTLLLDVPLDDAPIDSVVVGVAEFVEEILVDAVAVSDIEEVCVGEPVPVGVGDDVPVTDGVGASECDGVVEPVEESDPVFEGLAPEVKEAVAEREGVDERLVVLEAVFDDVPVEEPVGVGVGVPLSDGVLVMLGVALGVDV
jgi:hypothetical protein